MMSTRQPYDYALAQAEAARAAAEAQRRSLELSQLRAERAAVLHAEGLARRAEAAGAALDSLENQVRASALELERARTELRVQMDRLAGLERDARAQEAAVAATLAAAAETLGRVEGLQAANASTLMSLVDAVAAGRAFGAVQSGLEERIHQLEAEVAFITRRADLAPVAMVTLQAMESNGYRLQGTAGREEMVVYFQKEGAAHQIAVRMAPASQAEGDAQRWDLLAETFDMKGEVCLGELDDFETAVEERGLGRLRRKAGRVYPRDDSQALLPKPPRAQARRRTRDSGPGTRERA